MGKMCVECKDCHHVYGRWRPRCPACGTVNAEPTELGLETMTREEQMGMKGKVKRPKTFNAPKLKAPRIVKNPCAGCGRRGAKASCLVCGNRFHTGCLSIHNMKCKFVPITCDDVGKEHDWHEQPGEPPRDVCFNCGKEQY